MIYLTEKEEDILKLTLEGFEREDICKLTGMSGSSISYYVRSMCLRNGAKKLMQLVGKLVKDKGEYGIVVKDK